MVWCLQTIDMKQIHTSQLMNGTEFCRKMRQTRIEFVHFQFLCCRRDRLVWNIHIWIFTSLPQYTQCTGCVKRIRETIQNGWLVSVFQVLVSRLCSIDDRTDGAAFFFHRKRYVILLFSLIVHTERELTPLKSCRVLFPFFDKYCIYGIILTFLQFHSLDNAGRISIRYICMEFTSLSRVHRPVRASGRETNASIYSSNVLSASTINRKWIANLFQRICRNKKKWPAKLWRIGESCVH